MCGSVVWLELRTENRGSTRRAQYHMGVQCACLLSLVLRWRFARCTCCQDGHGTWTWADGTRYSGKWRTDLHHGHGIYLFSGGEMYEGDYNLGKRHGHGINTW